jgi:hypothetical protein
MAAKRGYAPEKTFNDSVGSTSAISRRRSTESLSSGFDWLVFTDGSPGGPGGVHSVAGLVFPTRRAVDVLPEGWKFSGISTGNSAEMLYLQFVQLKAFSTDRVYSYYLHTDMSAAT